MATKRPSQDIKPAQTKHTDSRINRDYRSAEVQDLNNGRRNGGMR